MAFRPLAALLAALRWHARQLRERPYTTNALTSAGLMLVGDRVAQRMEHRGAVEADSVQTPAPAPVKPGHANVSPERASWTRTGVLTVWSGSASSMFFTWWYAWLHRTLPGRQLVWVALTAVVPAPLMNLAFFSYSTAAEHMTLRDEPLAHLDEMRDALVTKVRTRWLQTVATSTQMWGVVNLVNFYFVPLDYRMLFGSMFAFGWSVYLSLQQHAHEPGGAGGGAGGGGGEGMAAAEDMVPGPDTAPPALPPRHHHIATGGGAATAVAAAAAAAAVNATSTASPLR